MLAMLFELAIFVAPLWLAWHLQKGLNTKMEIVAPFALRLLYVRQGLEGARTLADVLVACLSSQACA